MENIKVFPSKSKLRTLIILGIIMTSASCLMIFFFINEEKIFSIGGAIGAIIGYSALNIISYRRSRKCSDKAKQYISLKKQIKHIIIFALIMLSSAVINNNILLLIIGVFGAIFFGFCTCYSIYRMFSKAPSLEITSIGIFDNSNWCRIGQVNWSDIKDVFTYEEANNKMLGIVPYDIKNIRSRMNKIKRLFLGKEEFISIPQNILSLSVEELEEEIRERINLNDNIQ